MRRGCGSCPHMGPASVSRRTYTHLSTPTSPGCCTTPPQDLKGSLDVRDFVIGVKAVLVAAPAPDADGMYGATAGAKMAEVLLEKGLDFETDEQRAAAASAVVAVMGERVVPRADVEAACATLFEFLDDIALDVPKAESTSPTCSTWL